MRKLGMRGYGREVPRGSGLEKKKHGKKKLILEMEEENLNERIRKKRKKNTDNENRRGKVIRKYDEGRKIRIKVEKK